MNITIEDFAKVEIRVGTVAEVEKVPDADRLLRLIFDFGSLNQGEKLAIELLPELMEKYPGKHVRQIMSAIAPFIADPNTLVGKQICVVTNLEPRKFRGYESQGMIMAVGDGETGITFLGPEHAVPAGMKAH